MAVSEGNKLVGKKKKVSSLRLWYRMKEWTEESKQMFGCGRERSSGGSRERAIEIRKVIERYLARDSIQLGCSCSETSAPAVCRWASQMALVCALC